MKVKALLLALALAATCVPVFAGAVHLTTDWSADFLPGTSAQQIVPTFSVANQPVMWGVGWEIITSRMGFGGDYMVSFAHETVTGWWLDWYAPSLYLSWHPLSARRVVDPSLEVGVGCAGRVRLSGMDEAAVDQSLSLALFPFAAAGLSLNLDGLLLGAKAIYTPFKAAIPMSTIPLYPLGQFQVMVSVGIALGW